MHGTPAGGGIHELADARPEGGEVVGECVHGSILVGATDTENT
jgi:hypothetical protein